MKIDEIKRLRPKRVVHDSREVQPGDFFVALGGERADGHDFLDQVAARGAKGALVRQDYEGPEFGLELIRVPHVEEALRDLAQEWLRELPCQVVGITGSIGKTSCKSYLATLLKERFRVHVSPRNFNSQIGLPLTLLNTPADTEVLVLEMAMSRQGQLRRLAEIAPPDIAVVTWVTYVHSENFSSLAEIAQAKAEILSQSKTRRAILYAGLPHWEAFYSGPPRKTFALEGEADFLLHISEREWRVQEGDEVSPPFSAPLDARPERHNFLAAVATARELGLTWEEIISGATKVCPVNRRLELVQWGEVCVVNDCYNACEDSMKAALDSLPPPRPGGKRIAVLGEMRELGAFAKACHEAVGRYALDRVDLLLTLGEGGRLYGHCWEQAGRSTCHFHDRDALKSHLWGLAEAGDSVLLKGASGLEMWRLLER